VWAAPLPPLAGQRTRPDADDPGMTWAPGTGATSNGKREMVGGAMGDAGR
jgi:hypothetical protein